MKPKQYLVFGFKTIVRVFSKGGFDDLLGSSANLEEALVVGDKFLNEYKNDENLPRIQIVDLNSGLKLDINLLTREIDTAHAREMFRTTDMDRHDQWSLH